MKNKFESFYRHVFLSIDLIIILFSFHLAHVLRGFSYDQTLHDQILLLYSIISWFTITKFTKFYTFTLKNGKRLFKYSQSFILFGLTIALIGFVFKTARYSRLLTGYYILSYSIIVSIVHIIGDSLFLKLANKEKYRKNLLILGSGRVGEKVRSTIIAHPEFGYNFLGFLDDSPHNKNTQELVIGKINELENILKKFHINEIIIALPLRFEEKIKSIIEIADRYGIRLRLVPDIYRITTQNIELTNLGDVPIFQFRSIPLDDPYNRFIKRSLDILISLVALTFSLPIILLAGVLIKLTSKGPIFFVQERTGYNQKSFKVYKIRTMKVTPVEIQETRQATSNDDRITKIGRFLRKTNIDELPQFWNVLKGDMSVVGPRPHMLYHTIEFKKHVKYYLIRHFIKPGITGWAQVNGWRGPTDSEEKLKKRIEYDLWYMNNWSLWLDLKIIFLTIFSRQSRLNAF
ncbi:MAG: undecaprenyl-phosphate glucose phosphotransferase [Candidatus Helarchaeota archaeon]